MKNLWLIRHAKSSWSQGEIRDAFRPLNERGYRDAPEMAGRLKKSGAIPGLIVSSPAIRAYSTAMIFSHTLGYPAGRIVIEPNLYDARPDDYLECIQQLPDEHSSVFMFGHNPTISQTAELLAGLDHQEMPTTGIVHITFAFDTWQECSKRSGKLQSFDFPKSGLD